MEVVILQDYLRCGGTEKHSLFLNNYFNSQGCESQLITFRPGGALLKDQPTANILSLQRHDCKLDWLAPRLMNTIGSIQPKTVLCMGRVANCYGGLVQNRFSEVAVITTVRTGKKLPLLYRWSLKRSHKVLVNAHWWKETLVKKGMKEDKVHVIHNPLLYNTEESGLVNAGKTLRQDKGVHAESCVFLCIQGFRPGKQHKKLIEAFSELPRSLDWELWLVGNGHELKKCQELVLSLGLEERIIFFGHQPDPLPFYEAADVAISCSKEDSLPNFIIEAQAMGLPVIAQDTKGTRETFMPGESGLLLQEDTPVSVSDACKFLIKDKTKRMDMGERGRTFASQNFNAHAQAEKTLNFIREVS